MVICNRQLIKEAESEIIQSDDPIDKCQENLLIDADIIDFRTKMDDLSFYEKTDFEPCNDLWLISNAECLWQMLVGEIKTPLGVLPSIGQEKYGCRIWSKMGKNIDGLTLTEFKHDIIQTCIKHPEVNNVIKIDLYTGNYGSLLVILKIDSIYGVFTGETRIPNAIASNYNWKKAQQIDEV